MRALAGPAMLLVVIGGFTIYKTMSKEDAPSREFTELELAADDEDHTGTCYSLSTVLIANGVFGGALRTWNAPDPDNEDRWTLELENVRHGRNGPEHQFQRFTFEKFGEQVRLVEVEGSAELPTDIAENIDRMLMAPHHRRSTATDRCREDGGIGYQYPPAKK
jgi:hypothetical protein